MPSLEHSPTSDLSGPAFSTLRVVGRSLPAFGLSISSEGLNAECFVQRSDGAGGDYVITMIGDRLFDDRIGYDVFDLVVGRMGNVSSPNHRRTELAAAVEWLDRALRGGDVAAIPRDRVLEHFSFMDNLGSFLRESLRSYMEGPALLETLGIDAIPDRAPAFDPLASATCVAIDGEEQDFGDEGLRARLRVVSGPDGTSAVLVAYRDAPPDSINQSPSTVSVSLPRGANLALVGASGSLVPAFESSAGAWTFGSLMYGESYQLVLTSAAQQTCPGNVL